MAANLRKLVSTKSLVSLRGIIDNGEMGGLLEGLRQMCLAGGGVAVAGRALEAGFRLHLDRKSAKVLSFFQISGLFPGKFFNQVNPHFPNWGAITQYPECKTGESCGSQFSTASSHVHFHTSPLPIYTGASPDYFEEETDAIA